MSLQKLQSAVISEAQAKAQEISAGFDEQRKSEEGRIMASAKTIEEDIIRAAQREGARRGRRLVQEANLKGRAAVLREKEAEIAATKQAFVKALLADTAEDKEVLKKLLSLLPDEKGEIMAGEHQRDALKKLVKAPYTLSDSTMEGEGGFVYRSNTEEVNLTFSHLASQLFNRHRAALARILFS